MNQIQGAGSTAQSVQLQSNTLYHAIPHPLLKGNETAPWSSYWPVMHTRWSMAISRVDIRYASDTSDPEYGSAPGITDLISSSAVDRQTSVIQNQAVISSCEKSQGAISLKFRSSFSSTKYTTSLGADLPPYVLVKWHPGMHAIKVCVIILLYFLPASDDNSCWIVCPGNF